LNDSNEIAPGRYIADKIIESVRSLAIDQMAADVRIGLGYTAVQLSDGGCGTALTFRHESGGGCSVFVGMRPLANRPASDLIPLLHSGDPVEAAVGLACANALANRIDGACSDGDILDTVDMRSTDRVAMVGHFGPLVEGVKKRASSLTIFERIEAPQGDLRPVAEACQEIPNCDVALITGTSIINHTLDALLKLCGNCREVVVLGASTPLLPEAFAGTPVNLLSGIAITDGAGILKTVSEGGGMRFFKPYIQKVNVRVNIT
jgi:uncharacterized protein